MLGFDKDTQERIFKVAEARARGEALEGLDENISRILALHPEFDELWPRGDVAMIAQPVQGQIVNPFVHVVLHGIIAGQLEAENPAVVPETFNRLKGEGLQDHEILHVIMSVYGDLHFRGVRQGGQFDHLEYEARLEQIEVQDTPGQE